MTDPLAGQDPAQPAPAAPPAAPTPDIEERLTQMQQQFEDRIKGFQRLVSDKDAALAAARQEAMDLRLSGMTDDEKAQVQWQQTQTELAQLRSENALLSLATEYPEELPEFRKILAAQTPKEQLELIRGLRKQIAAAPPAPPAQPEGELPVPPVDLNNPTNSTQAAYGSNVPTFNGQPITAEWADQVLRSVSRMR